MPTPNECGKTSWFALILGAAFAPGLVHYFRGLWSLEHYQFFPFALVGAAAPARRANRECVSAAAVSPVSSFVWICTTVAALLLLALSVLLGSPWTAYAGALAMLIAWLYGVGGRPNVVRYLPALLMLFVVLRPPLNLDKTLITNLQQYTARAADATLDVLNVAHVRSGNVVEIPGRRLFVEEACSGVNSLFSALACTLFYLAWTRRHWFVWLAMLVSVPLWVMATNAGRITLVALLRYRWGVAADEGWRHDALGFVVFAAAIGLILATERLLTFYAAVLPPEDFLPAEPEDSSPAKAAAAPRPLSPTLPRLAAAAACLLLVLQLPGLAREVRDLSQAGRDASVEPLTEAFLPETLGSWNRRRYEQIERKRNSAFGEYSQVWLYTGEAFRATASLDYPFLGWHELTECYVTQGWNVESRTVVEARDAAPAHVALQLRDPTSGRYGRLWFALMARDGRPIAVRKHGEWDELRDRFAARLHDFSPATAADDRELLTYQAQVFVESQAPLTETVEADGSKLFTELVRNVHDRWSVRAR